MEMDTQQTKKSPAQKTELSEASERDRAFFSEFNIETTES